MINTVKIQGSGYLVNGSMSVPNDTGNRHYQEVQDWIALGNIPEPEFTQAELDQQALVQAKIALSRLGYLTQVETALNALTGVQKTEALIAWNSTNHVTRTSQLVVAMQAALGLTSTQMDDLFTLANSIEP